MSAMVEFRQVNTRVIHVRADDVSVVEDGDPTLRGDPVSKLWMVYGHYYIVYGSAKEVLNKLFGGNEG